MTQHLFHDPRLDEVAKIARRYGMKLSNVPLSSGIGAPAPGEAPGSLVNSPISATPSKQTAAAIPFTRGSTLATMQDAQLNNMTPGQPIEINLQTNAYLEYITLDTSIVAVNTDANEVSWQADGPFNIWGISGIQLVDSANLPLITPISGFKLAQLNKFLCDTDQFFDPASDSGFFMDPLPGAASETLVAGSANFRLVIPVEVRRRDALGAITNSDAGKPVRLTLTPAASFAAGADTQNNVYVTNAPATSVTLNVQVFQTYWTQPPQVIVSGSQSTATVASPAGLGTLGFIRSELHKEIAGGGDGPFQLTSVGLIISNLIWTLRLSTDNERDAYTNGSAINGGYANWPAVFHFNVNDFNTLSLGQDNWLYEMSRFYGLRNGVSAVAGTPGTLDAGVFTFGPWWSGMFNAADNFSTANQFLATESGTKLQSVNNIWGTDSASVSVDVRTIRPISGATLYA